MNDINTQHMKSYYDLLDEILDEMCHAQGCHPLLDQINRSKPVHAIPFVRTKQSNTRLKVLFDSNPTARQIIMDICKGMEGSLTLDRLGL